MQLTNLYKQGRQNTHKAFVDGYVKALHDTIECLGQESPLEAQTRLDRLHTYLVRRLEALQSDAQEHDEGTESKAMPTASPGARIRRSHNERRAESHRTATSAQDAKTKAPGSRHEHGRRSGESDVHTPVPAPATPTADRPRKRRRPVWSMHDRA